MRPVDLRSDTVTRPTPAMRRAMAEAEVGDDVLGDDPTVRALEQQGAELLGKEAALFVPSGTMANQLAILLHCRGGDAALMEQSAHPFNYEAGGAALIAGVMIRTLPGERGWLDPEAVERAFPPVDPHFAPITLVSAEDTSNRGGGSVYPLERLDALAALAHARGAATHLDGARLMNAAVASGLPAARRAQGWDTVSLCLSKGLGAPVGSLLCGPRALLEERGRRMRKALGGGMRQSGILAAAGLHALEHHVERLALDHHRARRLAAGLQALGFPTPTPETNMVYTTVGDGAEAVRALGKAGVLCLAVGPKQLRLVTHLDVEDEGVERALRAFEGLRAG
jgi:threonine aldolase